MTTKTKTITPAEASRQRLSDAHETLAQHRSDLGVTRDEIEAVKRAWSAGDDTVPASRLTELEAVETRLSSLLSAAERQVKLAERALLTDKPELAEAIAFALGDSVHGIKAEPVYQSPKTDVEAKEPRLFVVQTKPHKDHRDGTVSGSCVIKLVGPAWVRPMDASAIQRTLHSAGVRFGQDLNLVGDQIHVEAKFASPIVPTIPTMPDRKGASVSVDVRHIIERETHDERSGETLVHARGSEGHVVSVSVDDEGVRTSVIDLGVTISNNPRGYWDADTATQHTKRIVSGLKGTCLPMIGRVTDVVHVSAQPLTGTRSRQITTRLTTVSKVRPA